VTLNNGVEIQFSEWERIVENINIFDFELAPEDMEKIAVLDENRGVYFSYNDPEIVKQFKEFGK
jgi:diketogulonate reductase-like aldo/keto reductase